MTVRDSDTLKSYFNLSKVITPSNYDDLVDTIFAQSTSGEIGDHTHDNRYLQLSIANVVSAIHTFDPSSYSSPFILGAHAQGQTVVGLKADQLNRSINVSGLGLSGGGILDSDRSISLASSSDPGASAAILSTDVSGHITLDQATAGTLIVTTGVASSLIPTATDAYDLGTSTKLWRRGWLSELDAILFAENTITLLGGWFIVGKDQGSIAADVATEDTSVDFGKSMTTGHFVVFRSSLVVEYMQVGTFISDTRYNVTRDLDGSGANAWPSGQVFLVLGTTGDGRIELNAYDTPRVQILVQGATYNAQTEQARLGDLNGNWGYLSSIYGIALGEYSSGKANLTWDPTNGLRLRTYSTTVIQLDNSGSAKITGSMEVTGSIYTSGVLTLDTSGIRVALSTSYYDERSYRFTSGGVTVGYLSGFVTADEIMTTVLSYNNSLLSLARNPIVQIMALTDDDNYTASAKILVSNTTSSAYVNLAIEGYTGDTMMQFVNIDYVRLGSTTGLVVGSLLATPGAGEIIATNKLKVTGDGSSYGLFIGTDTQIYRSAADILRTPDSLVVDGNLYTDAWIDYSATSTIVGWSSFTYKELAYKRVGKLVFCVYNFDGTSNNVNTTFTLPFNMTSVGATSIQHTFRAMDNTGAYEVGLGFASSGSNVISLKHTIAGAAWTASGTKRAFGSFWYEAA